MSEDHDVDESESPKPDETTAAIDAFLQNRSVLRSHTPRFSPRTRSQGQPLPKPKNAEATEVPRRAASERWEAMCAALTVYRQDHGDCRVPYRYVVDERKLGRWVRTQRERRPKDPEQARRLEALGLEFRNQQKATEEKSNSDDGDDNKPAATPEGSNGIGDDDYLLPARLIMTRAEGGMTPYGRIQSCVCGSPGRCRRLTYRWARLGAARYVSYVPLPRPSAAATPAGGHVNAYRDAVLRRLYAGGKVERTVTRHYGATVTTDQLSVKQQVSIVHFHPDLIPHLLREKDARKKKLEKYQVPHALGEQVGLGEEDKAPVPVLDADGLPSFFAVPNYDLDDATADVERAEAEYKKTAKLLTDENQAIVKQMRADPTKYMLENHAQKQQIDNLLRENKELKERMTSKTSQQFAMEEKHERLLKFTEKMARRLDTWERSAAVAQAPIQSAKDLYREATGLDLGEEGYYGVKSEGTEDKKHSGRGMNRKSWSDPRMERAVQAKWEDPSMSSEQALRAGGFDFPPLGQTEVSEKLILDADGVSVAKRKEGLSSSLQRRRKTHARRTGDYSVLETVSRADPRMKRAVAAMLVDPALGTEEGLRIGGFDFPSLEGAVIKHVVDADNVSVAKRKHALLAKLRQAKAREGRPAQKGGRWYEARKGNTPGDVSAAATASEDAELSKERAADGIAGESEEDEMAEESEEDEKTEEAVEVAANEEPDHSDVQDMFLQG